MAQTMPEELVHSLKWERPSENRYARPSVSSAPVPFVTGSASHKVPSQRGGDSTLPTEEGN